MVTLGAVLVATILLSPSISSAQTPETGFLNRSVVVDSIEYPYQVYVPRDYQSSVSWPVILSLHGGGSRGTDGIRQTDGWLGRAIRLYVDRYPAIVVFPQSPIDGPGWQELGGRVALAALDRSLAEFSTDASRVYLAGYSQGGNGSWYLSYHHPERFAAVVVVSGWIGERRGTTSGALYPAIAPASSSDPFAEVAQRISHIPIWILHGETDTVVPVEQSRGMSSALRVLGANVQYTELPGVGHNPRAYNREDLPAWLFEQRRR